MEKIENNNKTNEIKDTTGDTKVFKIIKKEDIEKQEEGYVCNQILNKSKINSEKSKKAIDEENIVFRKKETNNIISEKSNNMIDNKEINNSQIKNNEIKKDLISKVKNNKRDGLKITLVLIIVILVIVIFSTIFGIINMNNNKIINNIKINETSISNLTKEEAVEKLNSELNNNEKNHITITYGKYKKQINLKDINGKFDFENAVNNTYNIGRDNNLIINNYKTILTLIKGENITANFYYDEQLLKNKLNEICVDIPDMATDSSYIIEGNKLIIKNSKSGVKVKEQEFKQNVINAFSTKNKSFEIPVEKAEKKKINIEEIHKEIYKQPINAYYTTEPFEIFKEQNGLDFAISIDEAKKIVEQDKPEYEIELKEIKPEITISDIEDQAFPDILATFTTKYGTGDVNRNANIALAAKSINSVVVMPGEEFSYNDLIGECSTKTGYKTSTIYLNGKLSSGIGGGICQVSTTLYNAVLRANLEIVQRRNHSLGVTYVPAGHDAMVNIGTSDFKFKNNRDYPVKVVAYVGTGSITCEIKGLKQDTEYEVKLESRTIESTETKYKVETYKVLYLDGKVVSRTWLSTDTYKRH